MKGVMTMGFVTKYGSLFVPVIYWLVYLAARFTYNGLAGEYTPDFIQSISHDGVFIICSLLVFYLACLRIKDSGSEISAVLFWSVVGFHVAALVITFLICLWKGALLWDVIFFWQLGASMLLLFFMPAYLLLR